MMSYLTKIFSQNSFPPSLLVDRLFLWACAWEMYIRETLRNILLSSQLALFSMVIPRNILRNVPPLARTLSFDATLFEKWYIAITPHWPKKTIKKERKKKRLAFIVGICAMLQCTIPIIWKISVNNLAFKIFSRGIYLSEVRKGVVATFLRFCRNFSSLHSRKLFCFEQQKLFGPSSVMILNMSWRASAEKWTKPHWGQEYFLYRTPQNEMKMR